MSEWGRMQDVLHDEFDRQGVTGVDVDAVIEAIVNVRDFFPGIFGQTEARAAALDEAIAAVSDVRFQFARLPGDGADGDTNLGRLMDVVLVGLEALRGKR